MSAKPASKLTENQEKDGKKNQGILNKNQFFAFVSKYHLKLQFFRLHAEIIEEVDENGNPKLKIALLHGPPGLGKTTLAHVVAKHAGYNVVEMNASDDRSVEAFKIRLEAATQVSYIHIREPKGQFTFLKFSF